MHLTGARLRLGRSGSQATLLRRAVFPLVVVFMLAAIAAIAVQLFRAQTEARDSAMQRFSERAQTSAGLTDSVFTALGGLSGKELERRYGGAPREISKPLAK